MKNKSQKNGFTIIEVVLVLAIAGLIFLMVFVALPALQRSQRDTQRRDDMARFLSQLSQRQANNRNRVPSTLSEWNNFITQYLEANNDTFTDPNGTDYTVAALCTSSNATGACAPDSALTWEENKNNIYVYASAKCSSDNSENVEWLNDSSNQIAIRYKLEGAGTYCGNN